MVLILNEGASFTLNTSPLKGYLKKIEKSILKSKCTIEFVSR